jgi:hypothetical protein
MNAFDVRSASPSLCLTCEHEFDDRVPPLAFLFAEVDIGRPEGPAQVILVGICTECATQSDDELMRIGLAGLRERWPGLFGGAVTQIGEGGNA